MAETTLLIQLKWENGVHFTTTTKLDEADPIDIIRLEENACISVLWPDVKAMLQKFFDRKIDEIGNVMKAG